MFNDRLKKLREERNLTQQQLAEKLDIPVRTYRSYETNEREPNCGVLIRMAKYFNVTVDYLMGRDPLPEYVPMYISEIDLSPHETDVITAYRETDDKTREHVDLLLRIEDKEEENAKRTG